MSILAREKTQIKENLMPVIKMIGGIILCLFIVAFALGLILPSDRAEAGLSEFRIIYLEDGTRCAVFFGYNRGGLSCDWKTKGKVL